MAVCGAASLLIPSRAGSNWRPILWFFFSFGGAWIGRALSEGVVHRESRHGCGVGVRSCGLARRQVAVVAIATECVRVAVEF
jgi:hypothetical protein